jgi:hypothetical protein
MDQIPDLSIPSGNPGENLALEVGYILWAEGRKPEVAIVNAQRAAELLYVFNRAFLDLTRCIAKLECALDRAKRHSNRQRSIVLLERAPLVLRERGLTSPRSPCGSEDQRQAVLDADIDYLAAQETVSTLQGYLTIFRGKLKATEQDYLSVKRLVGDSRSMPNPNLVTGSIVDVQPDRAQVGTDDPVVKLLQQGLDETRDRLANAQPIGDGDPLADLFGAPAYED